MAGHSKWNNIKRKKEKTDAQKAKVFTKIGREIAVAVRDGGADPGSNGKLRDLIAKAKSLNVPNDNINRIIKQAEGGERDDYEAIVYEGYGPSGIAVMVETLTDNRNRTAANMRHYFDKYGASLGQSGSVAFQFVQKGVILIEGENLNEEQLMEDAFAAGADDFDMDDGLCEVECEPTQVNEVAAALAEKGYTIVSAEAEWLPASTVALTAEEDKKRMGQLLDHLEEDDDVQNVWHNLENEDELPR
ncbi:YebC/PmpR family DNA-binding transcriptional regulator [Ruminococcaceae bacterium OttesenSCG-928-O06]|nr:YebC/PmpR family DNA-binding transcriptional regulator [Ruminococcaceae bacterium OttesenSCG-928-O06]